MPVYLLVDNGSKKPEATLRLRELAGALSQYVDMRIHAVSLQHADSINPDDLDGIPADTFPNFLQQNLEQGEREFIVVPLFFGESRALTSFIPQQVDLARPEYSGISVKVADVVYPLPGGDARLAQIIFDHIQSGSCMRESCRCYMAFTGLY